MSLESEVKNDTASMLRTLKKYALVTPKNEYVVFEPMQRIGVEIDVQHKIIHKLETEGAIKIHRALAMGISAAGLEAMGILPQQYYIALTDKFEEIYNSYVEPEAPIQILGSKRIRFDEKTAVLRIGNEECKIPQVNQYELAKHIFLKNPLGERIEEGDVADDLRQRGEGRRTFFDTVRALNKLIEKNFGIVGLLKYELNSVRVRTELVR